MKTPNRRVDLENTPCSDEGQPQGQLSEEVHREINDLSRDELQCYALELIRLLDYVFSRIDSQEDAQEALEKLRNSRVVARCFAEMPCKLSGQARTKGGRLTPTQKWLRENLSPDVYREAKGLSAVQSLMCVIELMNVQGALLEAYFPSSNGLCVIEMLKRCHQMAHSRMDPAVCATASVTREPVHSPRWDN